MNSLESWVERENERRASGVSSPLIEHSFVWVNGFALADSVVVRFRWSLDDAPREYLLVIPIEDPADGLYPGYDASLIETLDIMFHPANDWKSKLVELTPGISVLVSTVH